MSVLVQRSVLGQSGYPLDQIHIRGIAARGFHGVLDSEREAGQDFSADVTLYLDTRAAARGDDLTETVNYALVAQDVHAILSGDPVNLVETVAERIADAVLARPQVISVDVTVHKPQAPIPLPFDDVVVTIHRDRVNVPVVSAPAEDDTGAEPEAAHAMPAPASFPPAGSLPASIAPAGSPAEVPAQAVPTSVPVQQVRPLVISRAATNELPVVAPPTVPDAPDEPRPAATPELEQGRLDVPRDVPPVPVPGADETAFIPRQLDALSEAPPAERPPAPTPEEIAILDEQARVSAALRRPEVFGMTRITAGTRPDLVLDQTVVFAPVPAPERAGAHHESPPTTEPADGPLEVPESPAAAFELDPRDVPAARDELGTGSGSPSASETTALIDPVEMLDRMDTRPSAPVDVVIALGGNLGDPQETLRQAVAELSDVVGTEIVAVGPLARTAAVGGPDQPDFLNTVVLARTTSSARELLHACQRIEQAHGRQRTEHWGPRTLDVDIILYDGLIDSTDDLELPHPRAHERSFVLAPWAHVDPDAVLPGLGGGPVGALAATAPDRDGIRWLALDWLHDVEETSDARRAAPPSIAPQPTGALPAHADDTDRPGQTEASTPRE